jgi:UDP-2-acetamido-2-deoxy-ribo-hexuluronate aminotransferase
MEVKSSHQMVDLKSQYKKIKKQVLASINEVLNEATFINGPSVKKFSTHLSEYLGVKHVIPCANGTDALQIAMMALNFQPGDEIIVPSFTYVATAEVIALLKLTPIMVDVQYDTFNIDVKKIERAITPRTKAIVPVHLYGQSADMEPIMEIAQRHNLYVIEDNAQAIGSDYYFSDGRVAKTGTIGHIGCTSFFPSKNLGCYGDGGAIFTNDDALANKLMMIANHGQSKKYYHDEVGCNSRLDSIQACVLDIKLNHLDKYNKARKKVADRYSKAFKDLSGVLTPKKSKYSSHVYHQYTLRVKSGKRDSLQKYLAEHEIPSMIYYPVPLYKQKAFSHYQPGLILTVTEQLSDEVISLPMHTEMTSSMQDEIINCVKTFFKS